MHGSTVTVSHALTLAAALAAALAPARAAADAGRPATPAPISDGTQPVVAPPEKTYWDSFYKGTAEWQALINRAGDLSRNYARDDDRRLVTAANLIAQAQATRIDENSLAFASYVFLQQSQWAKAHEACQQGLTIAGVTRKREFLLCLAQTHARLGRYEEAIAAARQIYTGRERYTIIAYAHSSLRQWPEAVAAAQMGDAAEGSEVLTQLWGEGGVFRGWLKHADDPISPFWLNFVLTYDRAKSAPTKENIDKATALFQRMLAAGKRPAKDPADQVRLDLSEAACLIGLLLANNGQGTLGALYVDHAVNGRGGLRDVSTAALLYYRAMHYHDLYFASAKWLKLAPADSWAWFFQLQATFYKRAANRAQSDEFRQLYPQLLAESRASTKPQRRVMARLFDALQLKVDKKVDEARAALDEVIAQGTKGEAWTCMAHEERARLLHEQGKFDDAEVDLAAAVQQPRTDTWLLAGINATRRGKPADALHRFRQAASWASDNVLVLDKLATALDTQGFYQEALDTTERILRLLGQSPNATYVWNQAYLKRRLGDPSAALKIIDGLLAREPKNERAQTLRVGILADIDALAHPAPAK